MKKVLLLIMYVVAVICHPFQPKRYSTWIGDAWVGWSYSSPRWKVFAGLYAAITAVMALA